MLFNESNLITKGINHMDYDLDNENRSISVDDFIFPKLLQLAHLFGWKPDRGKQSDIQEDGANDKDYNDWDGCYLYNGFQDVSAEDAKWIAASLQKALNRINDVDFVIRQSAKISRKLTLREKVNGGVFSDSNVFRQITEEEKYQLFSAFIDHIDYLKDFIDFFEEGGFGIC
jgi:hypothetical protein